ncbi:MAG: DinB family protein [Acidobacteriota bacterium]
MHHPDPIAEAFLAYSAKRLRLSQNEIARCCEKLTEEQMGHRRGDYENSIANLLLHLAGNMRQWILHGIDDQPDVRRRDEEFSLAPTATAAEARAHFDATLEESARVLAALNPARLLTIIDPQPNGTWRHPSILEAICKVTGHVEHHTGQIILLTKQLTATDLDLSMPRKR